MSKEEQTKTLNKIIILEADTLPSRVQEDIQCYNGLVEMRVFKNSGAVPEIKPLVGLTFGDRIKQLIDNQNLAGIKVLI